MAGLAIADLISGSEVADLYRGFAAADRRDDFRWLALSRGVPVERIDDLWRLLRPAR